MAIDDMIVSMTWIIGLPLLALMVGCVFIGFKLKHQRRILQQQIESLRADLDRVKGEMKSMVKAEFGVGKRLIRVEHEINNLTENQQEMMSGFNLGSSDSVHRSVSRQIEDVLDQVDPTLDIEGEISIEEQALTELFRQSTESS